MGHCRVFLDSLSSLQIQVRLQVLTVTFEFCLCSREPFSAFASPWNSNTAKNALAVGTLPALLRNQCLPQGPLTANAGALPSSKVSVFSVQLHKRSMENMPISWKDIEYLC